MSDLFNPELYVSDVSVYYGSKCAVKNVSYNIHPGQLTAIIGNNGCGKTSLIKAIMGLIKHNGQCQRYEYLLEILSVKKVTPAPYSLSQKYSGTRNIGTLPECRFGNPAIYRFRKKSIEQTTI